MSKSKYDKLIISKIPDEIASEIKVITDALGKDFSKEHDEKKDLLKNFDDLYELIEQSYPEGIKGNEPEPQKKETKEEKKEEQKNPVAVRKHEKAEEKEPTTKKEVIEQAVKSGNVIVAGKKIKSMAELRKSVEDCKEFAKEFSPALRKDAAGTDGKPTQRRSEKTIFKDKIFSALKTLTHGIKDEKKLSELETETLKYLNKVRSILGFEIGQFEKDFKKIIKLRKQEISEAA